MKLQRLASWTLGVAITQVAIGGFTRGSGSGYGCADRWPLCEDGLLGGLLPRPEFHMVVEWTHRWVAAITLVLVAVLLVRAWRHHRGDRTVVRTLTAALVLTVLQAGLGAAVVMSGLHADLVSVHLGAAMVLLALLAFATVHTRFLDGHQPVVSDEPDPAWRRTLAVGAGAVLATIMLGSAVHDEYVGGYPFVEGQVVPRFDSALVTIHWTHRLLAALTFVLLIWLAVTAVRRGRPRVETMLVHGAALLFALNIALGAAHVFTQVQSTGLVVAHLLVASLIWVALIAATTLSSRADRGTSGGGPEPDRDPVGVGA